MRVLITGGTGFIGQRLTETLVAHKHYQPYLLVREAYGMGTPLPPRLMTLREQIRLVFADLRTFSLTSRAINEAQPDIVVHLAAQGATDPFLSVDTAVRHNLSGTLNLLRACFEKSFTTTRLIVARTPGEIDVINSYAASKAAAWQFCRMYAQTQQWPVIGAMIFQCYGVGQSPRALLPAALTAARAGQDFPMTAGEQTRDFIHIDDVVSGLIALIETADLPAGATAELGTGIPTSLTTAVQTIYELVDQGGQPKPGLLPARPGEQPQPLANLAHTQQLIDWQPALTLRDGLKQLLTHSDTPNV
ncbi:MAG: NAD(P)-dependent oxidoreductase [Anaerolineales bacterium]|nr:NAD(P)-dependent oxidoreductase [Anaerolineales bacterium]